MLAVISPAKTLDFECTLPSLRTTRPSYAAEASELVTNLRKKSRPQLAELMSISEKLSDLNFSRYRDWKPDVSDDTGRPALFAFKGDVYTGFDLESYAREDISYAQKHLRILSGLYGILRPLDLIQPYRLEMGTKLKTSKGANLYEFWDDQITRAVNSAATKAGCDILVNLASQEYYSVLQPEKIKPQVITPQFMQLKNGSYKFLSFYGKKARGMMADFLIRERIESPDRLKKFSREGYRYNKELSKDDKWVFTRDEVPATT